MSSSVLHAGVTSLWLWKGNPHAIFSAVGTRSSSYLYLWVDYYIMNQGWSTFLEDAFRVQGISFLTRSQNTEWTLLEVLPTNWGTIPRMRRIKYTVQGLSLTFIRVLGNTTLKLVQSSSYKHCLLCFHNWPNLHMIWAASTAVDMLL
jgi:hypothetical protein